MQKPSINTLELTNVCNFKCPYCQNQYKDGERKVGFISVSLVKKLIKEKAFKNTSYLELQQNGEPLLHPYFVEIVDLLSKEVPFLGLSTNASSCQKEKLEALKNLSLITISVHPQTLTEDIIRCLKIFNSEDKTKVRIQTLDNNWHSVEREKLEGFSNVSFDNYDIRVFGENYNQKKYCSDLHYSVSIQWDGDVVPCCNFVGKQFVMGNVLNSTIEEVWKNRLNKPIGYCNTCKTPSPFSRRLNFLTDCLNS